MQLDREKFLACAAMLSLTTSACGGGAAAATRPAAPSEPQPAQSGDANVFAELDQDPLAPPRIAGPSASVEVGAGYVAPSLEASEYYDRGPCYEGYCPPPMVE